MQTNRPTIFIMAGTLLLSMLACNIGSSAPDVNGAQPSMEENVPATEVPANDATSTCTNPYLPVITGATWTYKLTGPVSDTFTRSIISVKADKFTDQDVFGTGVTRQGEWVCENGNLTALNPSDGGSATISTENVSIDFQTTASSGLTLPQTINAGDEWNQSTTLEGNQTINETTMPVKNEFTNSCKAIGVESITVEAGTFDAMKVECQTVMNLTLTINDNPIQQTLTLNVTNWYVENIGLVKTISLSEGFDSTIELTSYNIP